MARPERLRLLHHVFDWIPWGKAFTAKDIAEVLYRDLGGPEFEDIDAVEGAIFCYAAMEYLQQQPPDSCMFRRVVPPESPSEIILADDCRWDAMQPLSHADLTLLPHLREEIAALKYTLPEEPDPR